MKKPLSMFFVLSMGLSFAVSADNGILIAYFSHSGNTRTIANQIREQAGGTIFEIKTVNEYPADYNATVNQAKEEQEKNIRPELSTHVENMADYKTVFIGFPNWWYNMPMAVYSFLEEYDFSGKTIIPFCTHGGSGFSDSIKNMQKILTGATVLEGLALRDSRVSASQNDITKWLRKLKITK